MNIRFAAEAAAVAASPRYNSYNSGSIEMMRLQPRIKMDAAPTSTLAPAYSIKKFYK
jgi:hypothetical protein